MTENQLVLITNQAGLAADLEAIKLPAVRSNEAQKVINQVETKLAELSAWINNEAKKL